MTNPPSRPGRAEGAAAFAQSPIGPAMDRALAELGIPSPAHAAVAPDDPASGDPTTLCTIEVTVPFTGEVVRLPNITAFSYSSDVRQVGDPFSVTVPDRHGAERCRCTILEGGKIEYAGKEYGSLSAAGLQSARDLGLTTSTIDGWSWWGLKTKQTPAPSRTRKPAEIDFDSIDKAWDRYRSRAEEALKTAGADDADKLRQILLAHAEAIFALAQPAPASTSEPAASDTAEAA